MSGLKNFGLAKIVGLSGEGARWDICEYNTHKYAETTQVSKIIEMRGWCKEKFNKNIVK